jgi:hypothetical protein
MMGVVEQDAWVETGDRPRLYWDLRGDVEETAVFNPFSID